MHLFEQTGPVVFVADFEYVGVGQISLAEGIVEGRRDEIAHGLFGDTGNGFPFVPRDRFRVQGIEHQHAFACDDDAAAENSASVVRRVHVVTGNDLSQSSSRAVGDGCLRRSGARQRKKNQNDQR